MEAHNINPKLSFKQGKDNHFTTQFQRVKQAFFERPMTMKEVDKETGIMRENVCRYCRVLRHQNNLFPIKKRRCTVTGYPTVWEWTTNPKFIPKEIQLKLF